jgi:hypothetical protein
MISHPDGEWIGIGIGEGQDGSNIYWGRITSSANTGQLELQQLSDTSRVLVDIHASGATFLTTPQEQNVVQLHAFPSGVVVAELANDLNDEEFFDFDACYIDEQYALLKVTNGEDDSFRYEVVDANTLKLLGPLEDFTEHNTGAQDESILCGLGDATWLTISWPDSRISRWQLEQ